MITPRSQVYYYPNGAVALRCERDSNWLTDEHTTLDLYYTDSGVLIRHLTTTTTRNGELIDDKQLDPCQASPEVLAVGLPDAGTTHRTWFTQNSGYADREAASFLGYLERQHTQTWLIRTIGRNLMVCQLIERGEAYPMPLQEADVSNDSGATRATLTFSIEPHRLSRLPGYHWAIDGHWLLGRVEVEITHSLDLTIAQVRLHSYGAQIAQQGENHIVLTTSGVPASYLSRMERIHEVVTFRPTHRSRFHPNTPEACRTCRNVHGQKYGKDLLVCAMHPSGNENCIDYEAKESQ